MQILTGKKMAHNGNVNNGISTVVRENEKSVWLMQDNGSVSRKARSFIERDWKEVVR